METKSGMLVKRGLSFYVGTCVYCNRGMRTPVAIIHVKNAKNYVVHPQCKEPMIKKWNL